MFSTVTGLTAFTLAAVALIVLVVLRPTLTAARGGKILAFISLFLLPAMITSLGTATHLDHAKSTRFCLSCHVMEPYGESLLVDDSEYLPAQHFQNKRIDREKACFECHSTYTLFGGLEDKLKGLKHVYIYYLGSIPEEIELYDPYGNEQCLHCHDQARSFEASELHVEVRSELETNEMSCFECHDLIHGVDEVPELKKWNPGEE